MFAVRYSFESLYDTARDKTIIVMFDNTNTTNFISKQGGKQTLARQEKCESWFPDP